ncbi:MAG: RHS repeat-associated core domain-containing protein [Chitinophagales bacterium]
MNPIFPSPPPHYPFGMLTPGRNWSAGSEYRFGFQGEEMDSEIKGSGNSIYYKYRIHDPRLGRFLSVDPLAPQYAFNSPYAFSENRVIDAIELEGLEKFQVSELQDGRLSVSLIKITADFEVYDSRNNTTKAYFPEVEMDKQLGASYVDKSNWSLHTPDGNKFWNPNGSESNADPTPQNFWYVFPSSDPVKLTTVGINGGTFTRYGLNSEDEILNSINTIRPVVEAIKDENVNWKFEMDNYDVIDIYVGEEFKSHVKTRFEEQGYDSNKIKWVDQEKKGSSMEIQFKKIEVDRSDY